MWALGVVSVDEWRDLGSRMIDGSEAPDPAELFLEGPDEALAEAVLFRGVGRGVFLDDPVFAGQRAVASGTEDEPVVVPQSHAARGAAHPAEPGYEGLLEGAFGGLRPGGGF